MPNPGDQHKVVTNPFQEAAPRVNEYTAQEIATLQSRLEKQLGPEYLSARSGPSGQKVHYIAAEKVIALANEVFGFNGWSSSIQTIQIDFVDEHPQTFKISLGLSVIVRVTLRDGTFHEDVGYGHIENCKGKAAAFEKAKKEGTTDALKRALRNFGNVLGNCIYDKAYVDKVSKMKVAPNKKFDERGLHRHADYAVKTEPVPVAASVASVAMLKNEKSSSSSSSSEAFSMDQFDEDLLGDFDEADFCVPGDGHPDEIVVPEASVPSLPPPAAQNPSSRNTSPVRQIQAPAHPGAARPPQTPVSANGRPGGAAGGAGGRPYPPAHQQGYQQGNQQGNRPLQKPNMAGPGGNNYSNMNRGNAANANNNAGPAREEEGTPWLSARAVAKAGDGDALGAVAPAVQADHLFNPKAESPSIRKTPGIDHSMSKPIPRTTGRAGTPTPDRSAGSGTGGAAGSYGGPGMAGRGSYGHALQEPVRRIGAPPSTSSPLANRGQFRPPPMKRGPPSDANGAANAAGNGNRPPLTEVPSNVPGNSASAVDAKRPRLA